jgi:flavodoxin/Pyruvate/2-oxoacid:ferredoxin oxidoreductase delta subunit
MKKVLMVYFSQGETNLRVAEAISTGLRETGHQVNLWSLKDTAPPDPRDYDLLGIGSPTYYYRPPFNVTDYLDRLPDLAGLPAFVSVVHGTYRGCTGDKIRQALAQKGAQEVGYFHCHGAGFFLGYLKEGYLFSPDHPKAEELERAERFGRKITDRLAGEAYSKQDKDPPLATLYRLERFLVNRPLVKQVYSRFFKANMKCRSDCDLCMKQCPVQNITRGKDGRMEWGRKCLFCLSCEMNCPEEAITSPMDWPIFRPFLMYNTRFGSRDPLLDYIRVVHRNGRTQRLG